MPPKKKKKGKKGKKKKKDGKKQSEPHPVSLQLLQLHFK